MASVREAEKGKGKEREQQGQSARSDRESV